MYGCAVIWADGCEWNLPWMCVCVTLNGFTVACVRVHMWLCVFDGAISWSGRRMVSDQAVIIQSGAWSDVIGREAGSMIWLRGHYGHVQSAQCLGDDRCVHRQTHTHTTAHTHNKPGCLEADTTPRATLHKYRRDCSEELLNTLVWGRNTDIRVVWVCTYAHQRGVGGRKEGLRSSCPLTT